MMFLNVWYFEAMVWMMLVQCVVGWVGMAFCAIASLARYSTKCMMLLKEQYAGGAGRPTVCRVP
jgi:hypothetical protein